MRIVWVLAIVLLAGCSSKPKAKRYYVYSTQQIQSGAHISYGAKSDTLFALSDSLAYVQALINNSHELVNLYWRGIDTYGKVSFHSSGFVAYDEDSNRLMFRIPEEVQRRFSKEAADSIQAARTNKNVSKPLNQMQNNEAPN
jgi:hypothetical protein